MPHSLPWVLASVGIAVVAVSACSEVDPPTAPPEPTLSPYSIARTGYRPIDLGTLGGPTSAATAIASNGSVVGIAKNAAGEDRGFIWTEREGMIELAPLPGHTRSGARGITIDGVPFGFSGDGPRAVDVTWPTPATPQLIERPIPTDGIHPVSYQTIDQNGNVGGYAYVRGRDHAYYWSAGTGFFDLNDSVPPAPMFESIGTVILAPSGYVLFGGRPRGCDSLGSSQRGLCVRMRRWHPTEGFVLIAAPDTSGDTEVYGRAINIKGAIVGRVLPRGGGEVPFRWTEAGGFQVLELAPARGEAEAINAAGVAVGNARPSFFAPPRAALWDQAGTRVWIGSDDSTSSSATGINDRGEIVGTSDFGEGQRATLWRRDTRSGDCRRPALATAEVPADSGAADPCVLADRP